MIKKKIISSVIVAAMVLGIMGCGKSDNKKEETTSAKTEAVTSTSEEKNSETEASTEEASSEESSSENSNDVSEGASEVLYKGEKTSLPQDMDGVTLAKAIEDQRGAEDNEIYEIFALNKDKTSAISCGSASSEWTEEMISSESKQIISFLGFSDEDIEFGAFSISLINSKAYGIAVFAPKDGKDAVIADALLSYKQITMDNMQYYMEEQYEIAADAKIGQLSNGIIVMVMCEGSSDIYSQITQQLEK